MAKTSQKVSVKFMKAASLGAKIVKSGGIEVSDDFQSVYRP